MLGLTVQNFVSAATGIAVLIALIKGITRKTTDRIGNFWVDMTRSTIYVLLPLSIILAVFLAGEGVVQNFKHYQHSVGIEGIAQIISEGSCSITNSNKAIRNKRGRFF